RMAIAGRGQDYDSQGELTVNRAIVRHRPGLCDSMSYLSAQGVDHRDVRPEPGPEQRGLRIARLPGPQPIRVAQPDVSPLPHVSKTQWPQPDGALRQGHRPAAKSVHLSIIHP